MQRMLSVLVFAHAAVLGGCAAYRAEPLTPEAELSLLRNIDLGSPSTVKEVQAGQGERPTAGTFDPSDGLDESEVVATALTLNPTLRAKRLEAGEVSALLITAGQWPNPEVGTGLRWGIDGSSGYSLEADALFQLLRPGERTARKAVAVARVDQVRAEIVAAEFATVAEVRAQWLQVLVADQTVRLLAEEVTLRQRAADLLGRRKQLGEGTELDVSATQLELAEARRDLRKAETDLDVQTRELNRQLGLQPDYPLRLTDTGKPLTVPVFADLTDDDLDHRVLAGRPELRASYAAYERTEQELKLAVLGQYPRLGIGPSFERDLEGGGKSLGPALSLELPLFNRNQGEIAAAWAAREHARASYRALLHSLRADAQAARATLRRARLEVETQEREVLPLIRRNQELIDGAFRRGDVSVFDLITAQQRAVRARREYLESLSLYRHSLTRLEVATGMSLAQPATGRPALLPSTAPASGPAPAETTQPSGQP